jgi:hypothetical protein
MRPLLTITYYLFVISSCLSFTDSWSVDAKQHAAIDRTYKQGESAVMSIAVREGFTPLDLTGSQVLFYWFTNSAANVWWTNAATVVSAKSGVVSVAWTPAMDVGAAAYPYWLGIWPSGSTSPLWRVSGTIRLLPSPGFAPNSLPLPVRTLDFASITLTNAPWVTSSDWQSGSNALAAALQNVPVLISSATAPLVTTQQLNAATQAVSLAASQRLTSATEAVAQASALLATQIVHDAIAAIPPVPTGPVVSMWNTNGTEFVTLEPGNELTLWRVEADTDIYVFTFSHDFGALLEGVTNKPSQSSYSFAATNEIAIDGAWSFNGPRIGENISVIYLVDPRMYEWFGGPQSIPNVMPGISDDTLGTAYLNYGVATNYVGRVYDTRDPLVTADSLVEATNALIRTYLISSNAWITADWSNQTVSVSMIATNGATNTVSVGNNSNAIDPQATNLLWIALGGKADKAWGQYAPDGSSNPDPDYMTWLNAPATVFASGCSWSTSGAYAVLTTPGAVAYESGGSGSFRMGPDATNYFGYATGGSVVVGAVPASLVVTGGGTAEGYAEIVYEYSGGAFPTLWFAPSLAIGFSQVTASWSDNLDGTATATAPALSAAGFYSATSVANFSTLFISTMPAKFDGGVFGSTNALPVIYDSTIEVTSGGHTYRIPAQLAD